MVRVAIIGAGNMAEQHIKAFKNIKDVSLVGIYSKTFSRALSLSNKYSIPFVANSLEHLYEIARPQLLIIAVPVAEIKGLCFQAFKFPWITLIEKPLGRNLNEAKEIVQYAEIMNHKGFVAFNRRHYSSVNTALEILSEHNGPRLVQIFDQEDLDEARADGHPKEVLRDWMFANSIHLIDLLSIFGRGNIESITTIHKWNPLKPFFTNSLIKFTSGDLGTYQCSWNQPAPWAVVISNSDLRLELKPIENLALQSRGNRMSNQVDFDSCLDLEFKPGLRIQAFEAIKAVRGYEHRLPSLYDGLSSMILVQKLYEI
jgi:predicted dehydrogenase